MGGDHPAALYVKESLARALLDLGRADDASALLMEVSAAADAAADDGSQAARLRAAATKTVLARALCYQGKFEKARPGAAWDRPRRLDALIVQP